MVEASSCGVPVVGGTAGGIPDAVRDGETGLLADGEDPSAVAAAVRRILDDGSLHARLAAGGRAAVLSYYNWARVTRDMRGIATEFRQ
jgi:phosphatidylinositol alpha-1,6-mannosyltransferase